MKTVLIFRVILSVFFIIAGIGHFIKPEYYMRMMPPYILQPELMIAVSGVFEILGGIGVLVKRTRRIAGLGLIALLVAVFPANIHLALHPEIFPGMPAWGGWVRLPFQALFMFWVWKTTLAPEASA